MQVCDHCGACREAMWRVCPFCRSELETVGVGPISDDNGFDALAAASEVTDGDLHPITVPGQEPAEETDFRVDTNTADELLTEADLAHLTGAAGPVANDWATPPPAPTDVPVNDDDDGVPRALVVPLIAAAVAAVVFVAYSIVTQSPAQRPDPVAFVGRTTTTAPPIVTTTEAPPPLDGAIPIGVDIAEQAERMCRGDQFSIARSGEPAPGLYNDVMVAVQDGRSDWSAAPDQEMREDPVPPLVGCLRTADAGEIDRCPSAASIISRRAVSWSYRVLRTFDGVEVGSDSGTASDVRPCEELEIEAAGSDYGSWSPLPYDRLDAAAPDHTTAPHPQQACVAHVTREPTPAEDADADTAARPEPNEGPGLALHATAYTTPAIDHPLPVGWQASGERPVEAVLCLIPTVDLDRIEVDDGAEGDSQSDDQAASDVSGPDAKPTAPAPSAGCSITVAAMSRSQEWIGTWEYASESCPDSGEPLVPESWLLDVVGPELGYPVDAGDQAEGDETAGE